MKIWKKQEKFLEIFFFLIDQKRSGQYNFCALHFYSKFVSSQVILFHKKDRVPYKKADRVAQKQHPAHARARTEDLSLIRRTRYQLRHTSMFVCLTTCPLI
jgi:hypothetical protein